MSLLWILMLVPAVSGMAAFLVRDTTLRNLLWAATAVFHTIVSCGVAVGGISFSPDSWVGADALSRIFLPVTSLLFLVSSWHAMHFIAEERSSLSTDADAGETRFFPRIPEAIFAGCMLLFLSSMTFAILSRHIALQWVAIEATTLSTTPLIYFHQHRRSLEAAWKYLIICSVAIGIALLGVFFLSVAVPVGIDGFTVDILVRHASELHTRWLDIAFVFFLVGYGAKMGLAPMHTWLPDAHSEAPAPVSALLSGALLNCAFLGILRLYQVCVAAGTGDFGRELLVVFGLLSMGLGGVFMLRSTDYKRLLAYSSVEHMGILALGVGLGGAGVFGSLLHAINHSLVKASLFLTAGTIVSAFQTKRINDITGLSRIMPMTGLLWFAGFVAATGSPPFGLFISEFTILGAALGQWRWVVSAAYLTFLTVAFVGMLKPFLQMTFGTSGQTGETPLYEPAPAIVPQCILLAGALMLGIYLPEPLAALLREAAGLLGGTGLP